MGIRVATSGDFRYIADSSAVHESQTPLPLSAPQFVVAADLASAGEAINCGMLSASRLTGRLESVIDNCQSVADLAWRVALNRASGIVVVRNQQVSPLPLPTYGDVSPALVEPITRVLGGRKSSRVLAIVALPVEVTLTSIASAIPFFGYLLGAHHVGNEIVLCDPADKCVAALAAAADILIFDGGDMAMGAGRIKLVAAVRERSAIVFKPDGSTEWLHYVDS
jgi:hypothetical protein